MQGHSLPQIPQNLGGLPFKDTIFVLSHPLICSLHLQPAFLLQQGLLMFHASDCSRLTVAYLLMGIDPANWSSLRTSGIWDAQ